MGLCFQRCDSRLEDICRTVDTSCRTAGIRSSECWLILGGSRFVGLQKHNCVKGPGKRIILYSTSLPPNFSVGGW